MRDWKSANRAAMVTGLDKVQSALKVVEDLTHECIMHTLEVIDAPDCDDLYHGSSRLTTVAARTLIYRAL